MTREVVWLYRKKIKAKRPVRDQNVPRCHYGNPDDATQPNNDGFQEKLSSV